MTTFPILPVVFVSAFVAFLCELAVAQTMTFFTADALVWYILVVGVFWGVFGTGESWAQKMGLASSPVRSFSVLACLLSMTGGMGIILVHMAYLLTLVLGQAAQVFASGALLFLVAFCVAGAVGLLAGAGFFVSVEMARSLAVTRSRVFLVYALGMGAAGAAFSLIVLPAGGMVPMVFGAGLAGALLALFLSRMAGLEQGALPAVFATVLVVIFGVLVWQAPALDMVWARKYYSPVRIGADWKDALVASGDVVSLRRTYAARQQIDLVRFPSAGEEALEELVRAYHLKGASSTGRLPGWGLFVNGALRFPADFEDMYYEIFAHVPLAALSASPQRVLLLGGGHGLLARELLKIPSLQEIVVVDDAAMIHVARRDSALTAANRSALADPRVRAVAGNPYEFVRRDRGVYDAVYLDFPEPADYAGGKVFSYEFFHALKARLAPQGFVSIAAAGILRDELFSDTARRSRSVVLATLRSVGFESLVPFFLRLEEDNAAALEVMKRLAGGDTAAAQEMLREYVRNLAAGFLLAVPRRDVVVNKEFVPMKTLRVLNADRYRLSLQASGLSDVGDDLINSVFHHQLPRPGSAWKIRSPY